MCINFFYFIVCFRFTPFAAAKVLQIFGIYKNFRKKIKFICCFLAKALLLAQMCNHTFGGKLYLPSATCQLPTRFLHPDFYSFSPGVGYSKVKGILFGILMAAPPTRITGRRLTVILLGESPRPIAFQAKLLTLALLFPENS